MQIFISSDHAGFELKGKLVPYLQSLGYEVTDLGPHVFEALDDYPDYISLTAREISLNLDKARGIVIGGSGQGEAMVANRFPHVRAAVYYGGDQKILQLSREHNDANVLSIGARFVSEEEAKIAVEKWLETPFSEDERHVRRIAKIDQYPS